MPILIATLIVSLRHLLLGATLHPWLAGLPPRRAYGMLFFLTDESWALSLREFGTGRRDAAFFLGSGLTMAVAWIGGSVLGRASGNGAILAALVAPAALAAGPSEAIAAALAALIAARTGSVLAALVGGVAAVVGLRLVL